MSDFDYWRESIELALDDCGLALDEQIINCLAESISISHENYSLAYGYDAIPSSSEIERKKEKEAYKKHLDEIRERHEKDVMELKSTHEATVIRLLSRIIEAEDR